MIKKKIKKMRSFNRMFKITWHSNEWFCFHTLARYSIYSSDTHHTCIPNPPVSILLLLNPNPFSLSVLRYLLSNPLSFDSFVQPFKVVMPHYCLIHASCFPTLFFFNLNTWLPAMTTNLGTKYFCKICIGELIFFICTL